MPASRSVVSAVLQERFGHPDRAASVRQHCCPPPATSRLAHPATDHEGRVWGGCPVSVKLAPVSLKLAETGRLSH
jgi:hypothetical protein